MRIIDLEIHNIRGIKEFRMRPDKKSMVVFGPNGSGKSTIIDALDFLLTGNMSRFTGSGTGGITLSAHGRHVEASPAESFVCAKIAVPNCNIPVELRRSFASPNSLVYASEHRERLEPILSAAKRKLHMLTRKDILTYVTANPATRGSQLQGLLNISDIGDVRKAFVRVHTDATRESATTLHAENQAMGNVRSLTQLPTVNAQTLALVNQWRAVLNGSPQDELKASRLKHGLQTPETPQRSLPSIAAVTRDAGALERVFDTTWHIPLEKAWEELRTLREALQTDSNLRRCLSQITLLKVGFDLLDETGACPLCDNSWEPANLRSHIAEKIKASDKATEYQARIDKAVGKLTQATYSLSMSLSNLEQATRNLGLDSDALRFQGWRTEIELLTSIIEGKASSEAQLFTNAIVTTASNGWWTLLPRPPFCEDDLARINAVAKDSLPILSPQQEAWDNLTRLEGSLASLEAAQAASVKAQGVLVRAGILKETFERKSEEVLDELYARIERRFIEFYRTLHDEDEKSFSAVLRPEGAGVTFEVQFYNHGSHPPHALHSEGHQDSMGVCLFLALSEHLAHGTLDLVMLDDVVMSIDSGHRRKLCTLLSTHFSDRQLLITTHDRIWSAQLRSESIANSSNVINFMNWNIETGPIVHGATNPLQGVREDVNVGTISQAAWKLRYAAEEFFSIVCDQLSAPIAYKVQGNYDLGAYVNAAIGAHAKYINLAKDSANSWGKREQVALLSKVSAESSRITSRVHKEWWAINSNVHYNSWASFAKEDFIPIVDVFEGLFSMFTCPECTKIIRLQFSEGEASAFACPCGEVSWTLTKKK